MRHDWSANLFLVFAAMLVFAGTAIFAYFVPGTDLAHLIGALAIGLALFAAAALMVV